MQRAVAVELGGGDVIFHPTGDGRPHGVHHAQDVITHPRRNRVHPTILQVRVVAQAQHHAKLCHLAHLSKRGDERAVRDVHGGAAVAVFTRAGSGRRRRPRGHERSRSDRTQLLTARLTVQSVEFFGARGDVDFRADGAEVFVLLQASSQLRGGSADDGLLSHAELVEPPRRLGVVLRRAPPKREFLEFVLHLVHAQELGERGEHEERLSGDLHALLWFERAKRSHVVQSIGELDDDHAHLRGHGEEHLLQVISLDVRRRRLGRIGGELGALFADARRHLAHLGLALDDASHGGAESILDGLEGDRVRVLDGVVKEPRDDGLVVHVLVGEYTRDRDGMGHEGLARFASLAVVRVEGDLGRRVHLRALEVVEVGELVRDAVVQVVGIDVGPVGGAGHLIDRRARGDASASLRRFRGTRRGSSETSHGRARRRERGSRARGGMAVHPTVREVASMRTRGVPRREPREDGPCARHRSAER